MALAEEVVRLCERGRSHFQYGVYDSWTTSIEEKIEAIVKQVYHGDGVVLERRGQEADRAARRTWASAELPVCMAKTQYSFSDDASQAGRAPRVSQITVRKVKVSAGAGFIVALTGDIMTMPGLGKAPAAHKIDVMEDGTITGLF